MHFNYDIKSRARFEAQHANAREETKRFHGGRNGETNGGQRATAYRTLGSDNAVDKIR